MPTPLNNTARGSEPLLRRLLWIGLVAVVYFAGAKLGFLLAVDNKSVSAVWPPSGLAIAAMLLLGYWVWPGVFLGALVANLTNEPHFWADPLIAAGNTLEALCAAWIVNRWCRGRQVFDRVGDIARYVLIAAPIAVAISASIGILAIHLSGQDAGGNLNRIWLTWWLGDYVGALTVAPLLVIWFTGPAPYVSNSRAIEAGILILVAIAVAGMIFGGFVPPMLDDYPLGFLALPVLVWAAFRFGRRGAITVSIIASVFAIIGALTGHGDFSTQDRSTSLLLTQSFIGVVTVTSLVIAALVYQRRQAEDATLHNSNRLELALTAGNMGTWEWNIASGDVNWSAALQDIRGQSPKSFLGRIDDLQSDIHPDDQPRLIQAISRAIAHQEPFEIEYRIRRPDGGMIWLESRGKVFLDAASKPARMTGICADITSRKNAERRLAAEHAVTRILAEATSLKQAAPEIIRAFCQAVDGTIGELWVPNETGTHLRCEAVWTSPDQGSLEPFLKLSREIQFRPGEGLPGRVWAGGAAATIPDLWDDDNFPRRAAARECGLRSGHAFPVATSRAAGDLLGVIEFFTSHTLQADDALLQMMTAIGHEIAQFMKRQRAEEALHKGQEIHRSILDTALDGIISIDQSGRIIEWNAAAEKIFGYKRDQVINKTLADLIVPPQLREQHRRGLQQYLATGKGNVVGRRLDLPALRADGTEIPVELAVTAVQHQGGIIFAAHVRDISPRLRSEQAQRLLASIVTSSDDAIISNALDGTIITWNRGAERMFGYAAEEAIGQQRQILIPEELQDEEDDIMRRLIAGEHIEQYETERLAKDGRRIDVSLTVSTIRNSAGAVIGASKIARDITHRKALEYELQEHRHRLEDIVEQRTADLEASQQQVRISERMAAMGTLSTGIGHDMGNLLLPMRSRLDVLHTLDLPSDAKEHVQAIQLCIDHLYTLVRGLRLMAQDPDQHDPDASTDLAEWCRETLPLYSSMIHDQIDLIAEIPKELPAVGIASHVLTQAVRNLVKNSRDAIGPDRPGRIVLRAAFARNESQGEPMVRLAVIDDGAGMSHSVKARALEPFFTTKTRSLSTGLGLSTAHGMLHSVGGKIEMYSPPPPELSMPRIPGTSTRGAAVVLVLPLATVPPSPESLPPQRIASISVSDLRTQGVLTTVLQSMGLRVEVCANGQPCAGGDAAIWITEPDAERLETARQFLEGANNRTVVVVGEAPPEWSEIGAKIIERTCRPSAIRTALDD